MSASTERLGILLLGCGVASRMHSRVLRRIGGVELFYASRDAERAEVYRRRYGGRRAFGSYSDALAEPRVDVAHQAAAHPEPVGLRREGALRRDRAGLWRHGVSGGAVRSVSSTV